MTSNQDTAPQDTGKLGRGRWLFESGTEGSWRSIVLWWESRRFAYNGIVALAAGVGLPLFFVAIYLAGALRRGEDAVEPVALLVTPIVINLCYTAGWIFELAIARMGFWHRKVGPSVFLIGTLFSVAIVLMPGVIWSLIGLWRVVGRGR